MSRIIQQDATIYSLIYFCKLLYTLRVVTPPIIRSTFNCNYIIWHWPNRPCYLPLPWSSWNIEKSLHFFVFSTLTNVGGSGRQYKLQKCKEVAVSVRQTETQMSKHKQQRNIK